ncbi:hypothetical protein [Sporosalibacterium faouarense]|nr:hypothetical protein [Sporosalibacterium faouarense]
METHLSSSLFIRKVNEGLDLKQILLLGLAHIKTVSIQVKSKKF